MNQKQITKRENIERIYKLNSDGNFEFIGFTNQSGDIVENTFYMPYGEVISGGSERFGYTSKEKDTSTGLNYYGARYYDSYTRHFTQADSVIADVYNPQSLNRYSYVLNNPYKYVDPNGLWALQVGVSVHGSLGPFYGSIGVGKAYSYDPLTGEKHKGYYVSPAGGGGIGIGFRATLDISISPEAKTIYDLEGESISTGGSYASVFGGGIETNVPEQIKEGSVTAHLGVGEVLEVHGGVTKTNIFASNEGLNRLIGFNIIEDVFDLTTEILDFFRKNNEEDYKK